MKLLKIGGSLMTHKNIWREIDEENIRKISLQLKEYNEPLILVHGLGSFGRTYVPLYEKGYISCENSTLARNIQVNIKEFHNYFANTLLKSGVPVRSIDLESIFACENGKIVDSFLDIITYYINKNYVPILHGGTVWDDFKKYFILSSDHILEEMAIQLNPSEVIWASDVDGVLSKDENDNLTVMKTLNRSNLNKMWNSNYNSSDITGGMLNKVNISLKLADLGIKSVIVNGNKDNRIADALSGKKVCGTTIDK
ncbi:isopentenyl phosphate kinase [Clostridium sp. UBA7503]|uniref:isopentenyl phosphate kinase n=1 Tax=Clostridium sp. UBA7503 TaxID=1946377 RepID=UPI003217B8C7